MAREQTAAKLFGLVINLPKLKFYDLRTSIPDASST